LVKIHPSLGPPAEGIDKMVSIGSAETVQHFPQGIGIAVAVGIRQMKDLGGVCHIHASVSRQNPGWHGESLGKYGGLIGYAVAVGIFQDVHLVVGFLSGFQVWIGGAADDP